MLAIVDKASHAALRLMGSESRYVATQSGRVHAYELAGRGEGSFVMLHGLGVSSTAYTAVARRLRASARRILLVDLPGHGRSARRPFALAALAGGLEEALDRLVTEDERAVLLGTSLGGGAALRYALARPQRVGGLVLVSPAGAPLSDEELAGLRALFDLRTREDARRFFRRLLHAPPWYARLLESGLIEQLGHPHVRSFLASVAAADTFRATELGALVPPAVVLWGKSDRILPSSALSFYRGALPPGTRFVELDAVGHSPHYECPERLARELVEAYRHTRRA